MIGLVRRYAAWLHTRWPAGTVEPLPEIGPDGATGMRHVYVAGDLTGIPLLKFALESGARVARTVAADPTLRAGGGDPARPDLLVIGAGVAGMAAAVEARRLGLSVEVLEASVPFSTLLDFPRAKPIFTYPRAMRPVGTLQVSATAKEALVEELEAQVERSGIRPRAARAERVAPGRAGPVVHLEDGHTIEARRVLIAIGRSGHFRRLDVPGGDLPRVHHRLHDPRDFAGREVLVAGGGDAALEAAIALAGSGASVTLAHRGETLSRPRAENLAKLERLRKDPAADVMVEHPTSERVTTASGRFLRGPHPTGRIDVRPATRVVAVREGAVDLEGPRGRTTLANDVVFAMLGRAAPLGFFRRSRLAIAGEMTTGRRVAMALFLLASVWLFDWKSGGVTAAFWARHGWFPTNLPALLAAAGDRIAAASRDPGTLLGTLAISAAGPSFWYTLAYSIVVVVFGVRRIRRRRTPYVTAQTVTLMAVQVLPLFLIPEIVLPQLQAHGLLPARLADALFPAVDYGHGREFWRAYGLILAWPLNVYNLFTPEPLGAWIAIGIAQTLVLIPLGIRYFGKGVYCGWICSCGALAETLGDTQRHRMPHGPRWNRLNMAGQVILAIAVALLAIRVAGWILPAGNWADVHFDAMLKERYKWTVDVFLAGVIGYGLYFWYSGRVWCRFFCPLAALMHVYARFSRFAIVADKPKCISCNVCTAVCHQGIDVMNFANKGAPMQDPQCVRCSACVHACPTGVLRFGQVRRDGTLISVDRLMASPVQMREGS